MDNDHYLLDTHSLIWLLENNPRVSKRVKLSAQHSDNTIFFSQISLFEIAIKRKIGKLPDLEATIEEINNQAISDGFDFLPIRNEHIYNYMQMPLIGNHRDPFDRLLIATANYEGFTIITADEKFNQYEDWVNVLW